MTEPVQSSFIESVLSALLSFSRRDFPVCYLVLPTNTQFFAIYGEQHPAVSSALLLVATAPHCKEGSTKLLSNTAAFFLVNLSRSLSRIFFILPKTVAVYVAVNANRSTRLYRKPNFSLTRVLDIGR